MEKPQNKIMSILKINEQIKHNIFGLSFKDEIIEKEYIETEIRTNFIIKLILHFTYLYNFISKIILGKFRTYLYTTIIQAIFAFFCICSIIAYHLVKNNLKFKKFLDHATSYLSYFYQIIYILHVFSHEELSDKYFRLKSINVLNYLTLVEILFSYESSRIFPFLILIINMIVILMIFIKFKEVQENLNFFFLSFLSIFACIIYKRYINELNRIKFIQQYTFKKYYMYYYDIINNMNGYQFTMKNENILKYNENFKLDILNYKSKRELTSINDPFSSIKETNISKFINNFNDGREDFELNKNIKKILDLKTIKNFERSNNENGYLTMNENEFTIYFLKSLIAKKKDIKEFIKFTNDKNSNLYDFYSLIEKHETFRTLTNEFIMQDSRHIN